MLKSKNKVKPFSPKEEHTCSICLDTIGDRNTVTTKCGHHFHCECFLRLTASVTTAAHEKVCKTTEHQDIRLQCPNCRQSLYEETAKYIPPCKSKRESNNVVPTPPGTTSFTEEELRIHDKKIKDKETKRMNYKYVEINNRINGVIKKLEVIRDDVRKMSNLSSANETLKQKIIKKFSDFIY